MSKKYEVLNPIGGFLGTVTRQKAERAILYGVAERIADINRKVIVVKGFSMKEFDYSYSREHKKNINKKVKCWDCDKDITTKDFAKRSYCSVCKENKKIKDNEINVKYTKIRTMLMFERALRILEKQNKQLDIGEYKDAADVLQEYSLNHAGKFDSSHEMLVAMQMIKDRIHLFVQPTVASRRVDFILNEEKIVLEVDGYLHEHSQEKDYEFDKQVREELGKDWEVIRIPTKYIETNITMIYEAVMELKIYKQKLRESNYGIIPDYYSKREKEVLGGFI